MSANSKIYIAAKPVTFFGADTGKKHLYLVYDEDGDPSTSTDQKVLRGGPQTEGPDLDDSVQALFNPGNIELELGFDLGDSLDDFDVGEDHADRHYTTLNPPGSMTVDQFWAALVAEANSMWNGDPDSDSDNRALTDASYTLVETVGVHGLNSNSVVASLLAATGVDIYANLPKDGGDGGGSRLDASLFPQLKNLFLGEGESVSVADAQVGSITDLGTDDSTITIDASELVSGASPLILQADSNSMSTDKIVLQNITLSDLKYFKRIGDDLWVFLTDDDLIPSLMLNDQFAGKGFAELEIATGSYEFVLTNPSNFPLNAASLPTPSGGYKTFAEGTYDKETLSTTIASSAVDISWNTAALFTLDLSAEKVTFASGLEIDDLTIDPGFVLEAPGEAETPIEAALDYLEQLGVEMTAEELEEAQYDYAYSAGTPYTHSSGYVEALSFSAANYHFNNPPGPNATITGPEEVTIITGYDGETPIYGQVAPTDIYLHASGDISRDTISNVNVLDVSQGVSLTEAQFEQFDLFTGDSGMAGNHFTLTAATAGEFDASAITVDAGAELAALYATSWAGTTLIGSDQDGQELYASLLGDDTLQAGTGSDTKLYAGGGKNTLIGSSNGDTKRLLAEVLVASFFLQLFALVSPLFFQVIIDKVLVHRGLTTLDVLILGLVIIMLFESVLTALRTHVFAHTTSRIDVELGARLFRHLAALPIAYFEARRTGDSVARVREIENIRNFLTGSALTLVIDLFFTIVFLAVMATYSLFLTAIVLISIPLYVALSVAVTPFFRQRLDEKFSRGAENQSFLVESINGIETLKAMAVEPQMQRRWEEQLAGYVRSGFRVLSLGNWASQGIQLISKLCTAAILFFGAHAVMEGRMSVGELVAFNMLAARVAQPVLRLAQIWQDFQQAQISIERLGDILNTPAEPQFTPGRTALPAIKGEISFDHVRFRYRPDTPTVLHDVSFHIPAGQMVGIVGPSGSGKSTLTKLIQRLHAPEAGHVLIDGIELGTVDVSWLRRQIGVVLQENVLFNRSIRDNIAFAEPGLPIERVIQAAKLAGAHDFILELPQGYDAIVGERGASLSGGQRQRIAIARALITNPRVLILDEATSALDYESERIIHQNMRSIAQGRTVIIIAHRLSAVRHCHRILTLEKGRLIEDGSHDELLQSGGRYADLLRMQEVA